MSYTCIIVILKCMMVYSEDFRDPKCKKSIITKTCLCNVYPLEPHFYIAKLGVCRGIPIFLIFAPKHRLWVLVRTASSRRF